MSSESDIDEFYDAQDVTPARQARLLSKSSISEAESWQDLEREENRLLERQKSIENQRRHEEEEIKRKLASLDRKKQKELEKQEARRRASQNELRQKKLEQMRLYMCGDGSPEESSPEATPTKPEKDVFGAQESKIASATGDSSQTRAATSASTLPGDLIEEKLEALSFELEQSGHLNRLDFFTKPCDSSAATRHHESSLDSDVFTNASSSLYGSRLDRTVNSIESDCFEDAAESPLSTTTGSTSSNLNESSIKPLQSKKLERLIAEDSSPKHKTSSLPLQLTVYPAEVDLIKKTVLQEPDIIQSTKSLPRQHSPVTSTPRPGALLGPGLGSDSLGPALLEFPEDEPVAPPRRKRNTKTSSMAESNRDSDASTSSDLQPDPLSLSSYSNHGNLAIHRPSLDLCAATQGTRHVLAQEDAAAKGEDEGLVAMDAVDEEEGEEEEEGEARPDDSLDVLVLREDSVVSAATDETSVTLSPSSPVKDSGKAPWSYNLARQKSKTLGGGASVKRSNSGAAAAGSKVLTDKEILEQVMVTNLDTGEKVSLNDAERTIAPSLNPLSLHIMRRTKEYSSDPVMTKGKDLVEKEPEEQGKIVKTVKAPKKRGKKIKKFLSKSVRKIKSELKSMKEDRNSSSDEDEMVDGRRMIKIKASHSHKGPYDFDLLVPVQNLAEDSAGAVWTMKFSHCGQLLATGSQDNLLKIWVLKSAYPYFDGMRQKYSEAARVSPTPSMESTQSAAGREDDEEEGHAPFMRRPFCVYRGHTADLLDVSWSKNYFILSSSMDKTVRLWHVSRKECLCCFQHIDFVTAIAFHPKDDRYFLSGSLDGKLRLWSIPEKKVALWNEVSGQSKLITAANFCSDGQIAVGTYDGRCVLYTADHLDYHTQIHVRSTRGKNAKGGKITGVEPLPGENKILVTSNDSRVRLYDLRDKTLTCKYKGTANNSSRIKASFSHDGRYIICGSEDGCVYIWRTQHDFYKFYSVRRDRNDFWEAVKAHAAVVTAAIFAPVPSLIIRPQFKFVDSDEKELTAGVRGEVVLSADFNGAIKVFINKFKPGSG